MHRTRLILLPLLGLITALLLSGCQAQVDRNADGSLHVETTMTEDQIQQQIETAISGKQLQDVTVDLREDWIMVSGTTQGEGGRAATMQFRLDLSAVDGRLSAVVSEVQVNGRSVPDDRVAGWNQKISEKLAQAAQKNEKATLQRVTITPDAVTMQWRVAR